MLVTRDFDTFPPKILGHRLSDYYSPMLFQGTPFSPMLVIAQGL